MKTAAENQTIGCLCLHGFTGSPWEVEPIAAVLRACTDWIVETPVLPGHADGSFSIQNRVSYVTWIHAADRAAKKLAAACSTLYVIGFSMGGLLACYVAARYQVERLVLIGMPMEYINPGQFLKDTLLVVGGRARGSLHPWYGVAAEKLKTPGWALREFQQAAHVLRPFVGKVSCPVFIGQGEKDGLVPVRSAVRIYKTVKSPVKQFVLYKNGKHFLFHGPHRHEAVNDVRLFLTSTQINSENLMRTID
ncbi:Esterase/lipase [Marinococcus luteus]|uniref:Esterase/lipase n=1 Tax=Marinococcus luteus TaxID=1122204 RepID=A0A1H2XHA4_9BACI|nr:alpha/beta fold hydrolase [Marinococcus luteus]SDW92273.1 Esterase/lipase [Marinococcus luteus]